MKKQKVMLFLKLLLIPICVVSFFISYFFSKKKAQIDQAKQIIERAEWFCSYIPDSVSARNIIQGLSQLVIVRTDSKGGAELNSQNQFYLLITPQKRLTQELNGKGRTIFQFDPIQMEKDGHIVIMMDEDIGSISENLDGKACFLIHEFIHAVQANDRIMRGIKTESVPAYPDERQAWESSTFLYGQVHPEIMGIKCDCGAQTIYIEQYREKIANEPLNRNFILFNACKDRFLQNLSLYRR